MRSIAIRSAALIALFALTACAKSIQPTPSPEPFRGEFPLPVGYDGPYDDYGPPPPPDYGPPPEDYGYGYGAYDEKGYAAPQDYHWYTAREYRRGGYAHEVHGGYSAHSYDEGLSYRYKYRLKERVIRLEKLHLKKVREFGYAAPPVAYEFSQSHYEEHAVKTYRQPVRKKTVRKAPVRKKEKTCICRYEKRVEDLRDRMHDSRIKIEGFDKGYRLEMPGEILFALDSDVIRPEAHALIRSVAGGLRGEKGAEIDVNGYTDTSGTDEHNDLLSQSRAVAVADALVRAGVAPDRINPRGFGESLLAVPTPDGVREARNRRVEIVVLPKEG